MKEKGFTLIELLAVIVILAIIALIAVPIVLNIINSTKISANERSAELYIDAVEQALAKRNLKEEFNPTECTVTNGSVICDGYSEPLIVEVNGESPLSGTIKFDNGKVVPGTALNFSNFTATLNADNKIVIGESAGSTTPTTICTPVDSTNVTHSTYYGNESFTLGNIPSGNYAAGDEYICEVKEGTEYHFYVLNTEGDNVNLIMNRNICIDGSLATNENICQVNWITEEDYVASGGSTEEWTGGYETGSNSVGPVTAMKYLYQATSEWTYVPNVVINYSDNGSISNDIIFGYGGISSNNGVATFTDYLGNVTTTLGTSNKPLKARLPKYSELNDAGCKEGGENNPDKWCPYYLIDYMSDIGQSSYYSTSLSNIIGYWTISSYNGSGANRAWVVRSGLDEPLYNERGYGVRPVISVPKSLIGQ